MNCASFSVGVSIKISKESLEKLRILEASGDIIGQPLFEFLIQLKYRDIRNKIVPKTKKKLAFHVFEFEKPFYFENSRVTLPFLIVGGAIL